MQDRIQDVSHDPDSADRKVPGVLMNKICFNRRWWSAVRAGLLAAIAGLLICAGPGLAWGAGKKPKAVEPPAPKGYTMMYIATIVAIVGGVAVVCLPSRRKKEVE